MEHFGWMYGDCPNTGLPDGPNEKKTYHQTIMNNTKREHQKKKSETFMCAHIKNFDQKKKIKFSYKDANNNGKNSVSS